jgi:hypothetical protein
MNKKGSLNLSIEAIVIVVIAFTVLGLGLGFVKTQIGDIGKTSSSIQEQISQQILDDLRTGNKKLSFPATKLTLSTSEESVQAIGVKNTEDSPVDIIINFDVKSGDKFESFTSQEALSFKNGPISVKSKIDWDDSSQPLKPGESRVFPVTITAPDKTGNYLYKITLKKLTAEGEESEFDSRTFFIKTS